jgi:hypothetical protein
VDEEHLQRVPVEPEGEDPGARPRHRRIVGQRPAHGRKAGEWPAFLGGGVIWGYVPSMKPPPSTARTDATATTT